MSGNGKDMGWNEGHPYYCDDIRTRCRASLGRWPSPELLQALLAVLQLEHGVSLSHRICRGVMSRPYKDSGRVVYLAESALVALQKAGPGPGVSQETGRREGCHYWPFFTSQYLPSRPMASLFFGQIAVDLQLSSTNHQRTRQDSCLS